MIIDRDHKLITENRISLTLLLEELGKEELCSTDLSHYRLEVSSHQTPKVLVIYFSNGKRFIVENFNGETLRQLDNILQGRLPSILSTSLIRPSLDLDLRRLGNSTKQAFWACENIHKGYRIAVEDHYPNRLANESLMRRIEEIWYFLQPRVKLQIEKTREGFLTYQGDPIQRTPGKYYC